MTATDHSFLDTLREDPGRAFSKEAWQSAEEESDGRSRTAVFWMSPGDFLAAALYGRSGDKEKHVRALVQKHTPFSSIPYLLVDNRGDGAAQVMGHEGRHRSMVLQDLGVSRIPVRITVRSGVHGFRWSVPSERGETIRRPIRLLTEELPSDPRPRRVVPFPTELARSPYRTLTEACPCGESQDPEVWMREDHAEITEMVEGVRAQIKAGLWGRARTQFGLLVQELTLHFATEETSVFARLSALRHLDTRGKKELARLKAEHAPFRKDMARIQKSPTLAGFGPFADRIERHARDENALLLPPTRAQKGPQVEALPAAPVWPVLSHQLRARAETISDYYRDNGRLPEGVRAMAQGTTRIVVPLGSEFVLKLPHSGEELYDVGQDKNRAEVEAWDRGPANLKRYLVPVVADGIDGNGEWLVMPRVDPIPFGTTSYVDGWCQRLEAQTDGAVDDCVPENVGYFQGSYYLLDYPSDGIAELGMWWDEDNQIELLPARSPGRIERDYGQGLAVLTKAGINLLPYEEPYEVFTVDGEVVGASTFGWKEDDSSERRASFSVGVLPSHRRKGIARRLVQSLVRQHPGARFETWVISEHMAALLGELGFSTESSSRGWTPDSPYMTLDVPTRKQVQARKQAALARKNAPPPPPSKEAASWGKDFKGPVTLEHLFLPEAELEEARKLRTYYQENPEERQKKIQVLLRGPSPIPGFTALSVPGRGSYWQIVLKVNPTGGDESRPERVARLTKPVERLGSRKPPHQDVFSRWVASDHTDRVAARDLTRVLGWDVWAFYKEPGVDKVFWDGEIEDQLLRGGS